MMSAARSKSRRSAATKPVALDRVAARGRPVSAAFVPAVLAAAGGGIYLLTAAPSVSWRNGGADGAELAAAAYVWGVAHPPGYPLYLTVVRLAQLVPVGDLAYRATLVSV